MILFARPADSDARQHRRVGLGLLLWVVGLVGLIIVPLLMNGWDRPGLFAEPVWRFLFGGYLLVSGFSTLYLSRTLAEFHARRDEQSWPARVIRRVFFWARPSPMSYLGDLLGQFIVALMLVSFGLSICIDRFPHPTR